MLCELFVKNLGIVDNVCLDFEKGLHVITGETGAGKSILLNALNLAVGARARSFHLRTGVSKAEVTARFILDKSSPIIQIADEHGIFLEEINNKVEVVLRRVISKSSSKSYINESPVVQSQVKSLAPYLVQINSQNQQQRLLDQEHQRDIVDAYTNLPKLKNKVRQLATEYNEKMAELQQLKQNNNNHDRQSLLQYQITELQELSLASGELVELNSKHKKLHETNDSYELIQSLLTNIDGDANESGTLSLLTHARKVISQLPDSIKNDESISAVASTLENSLIDLQEASNTLNKYLHDFSDVSHEISEIENRLQKIHDIARKMRINPESIITYLQKLQKEQMQLELQESKIIQLQEEIIELRTAYFAQCTKLSAERRKSAEKLSKAVTCKLKNLDLKNAKFRIDVEPIKCEHLSIHGQDLICFKISTNPGEDIQSIKNIASGGEISRVSLAILMITAQLMEIPCLIFDEIDSGVSGSTSDIIGRNLKELSQHAQLICITHSPQVAAYGQHNFKVQKSQTKDSTYSSIIKLSRKEKVNEIARLVGGESVTDKALAHADSLIELVE